ncbi:BgTH12-03359 [Blumeria graminis f. sp. triticale]|uniref:BgTH12-03359 n=1 Tax=Blumeria graminis f. sp. triticale TaxID=1689686 RepID=A0A9W4D9C0_BLUGR|nr:BgTH12-03359 [Blumeria graminis f. sp. triticale]
MTMSEQAMLPDSNFLSDEGYSEDPLTRPSSSSLPPWFLQMSVTERTGYIMEIISHLPTSQVAEIVSRLRPRLYINFFERLPNEVLLHILGFLDATSLLQTACVSREWMSLALEPRLWKKLYLLEGFRIIRAEVKQYEDLLNKDFMVFNSIDDKILKSKQGSMSLCKSPPNRSKDPETPLDSKIFRLPPATTSRQEVKLRPQALATDLGISKLMSYSTANDTPTDINEMNTRGSSQISTSAGSLAQRLNMSSLFVLDRSGNSIKKRLNWQYLYSQRRRLESNWESEQYVNFQLPDPTHPEEAHCECIYTIQHCGKYLVSGSRDKTVRIWNLDTRRLSRPPLRAHSGSVLCLQFDADPSEDLIVSGSSDATVILWKFSTGQVIQRLRRAHKGSVLNVQFDKRVLVTCSKDKTIKIFNRKPLHPGELGYPGEAEVVDPVPTFLNNYGMNVTPSMDLPIKPAYSLIRTLEGHSAAVNAVQIRGEEVVSASGDRLVKVWNWPEQTCLRTLIGHSKGIACVQYDGRRIVSGSSDNEVKVFDKQTGLEVASLRAHKSLVRTVQAGFGDLPYSAEEDVADAKAVDYAYFKALDSGTISRGMRSERGRPPNAGSRKPEHITAYGAKLPPGGGGGRFGRIVSGSYDETIIIWRRDKEGIWKAQHTLKQGEAARAAALNLQMGPKLSADSSTNASSARYDQASPTTPELSGETSTFGGTFVPGTSSTARSDTFYLSVVENSVSRGPVTLRHSLAVYPELVRFQDEIMNQINRYPLNMRQDMGNIVQAAILANQMRNFSQTPVDRRLSAQSTSSGGTRPSPLIFNSPEAPIDSTSMTASNTRLPSHLLASNYALGLIPEPSLQSPHATVAPNPVPGPMPPQHRNVNNMARVFKLQFDARRIICCSQTNIIVGWDFANNDARIIEASRFFAPVE